MNERNAAASKSQMSGNLAGAGLIVAALGALLVWRASNLDETSGFGLLLIAIAIVLLVAAAVSYALRPKG